MDNNRSLAVLYLDYAKPNCINSGIYSQLGEVSDLKFHDYLMARITHSHGFSETITKEVYSSFNPSFNTTPLLPSYSDQKVSNEETGEVSHFIVSRYATEQTVNDALEVNNIVSLLLKHIYETDIVDHLLKCMAYFLVMAQIETNEPALVPHMEHFRNIDYPKFFNLIDLIGNRWQAEHARKVFREIYASVI